MDKETVRHVGQIGHSIVEHWPFFSSVFVVLFLSIIWSLKQLFVTNKQLNSKLKDVQDESKAEHKLINSKIDKIYEHLIDD